jgi:hypothetical protein
MKYPKTVMITLLCALAGGGNQSQSSAGQDGGATPVSILHYVMHTDVTLSHTVSEVWPIFKDMRRWYTEYAFEVKSGPPYDPTTGLVEGQVLKVVSRVAFPREPGATKTPREPEYFVVETIKVVPRKQIVAVVSGSAYDFKRYTVFYLWTMQESEGKTIVDIDSYGEAHLVNALSKAKFADYYNAFDKNWHRSWSNALSNLKATMGE